MMHKHVGQIILSIAFMLGCGMLMPPLAAQGRPQGVEQRLKNMKEKLSLTAEQEATLRAMFTKSQERMKALRDSLSGDRQSMRKAALEEMQRIDKEIQKTLTDDQKKAYEKMKQERRQNRPTESRKYN